ncbi:MAG TPA: zinc ribbon domain-containing protein [Candidatus Limnocylindria bacterium]|nr:zinc ribbon domain-containing protein [Candidatus Limnocylindria bacterium]
MPIYEFACPKCRRIYSFLSKRINPAHVPVCPKCGCDKLEKEISRFAMIKGVAEPSASTEAADEGPPMPDLDDPRVNRVMDEMERDLDHLDENNPKHMAHMLRKMKEIMPEGSIPKDMDVAIKRLEQGEDPEKIEADMGELFSEEGGEGGPGGMGGRPGGPSYSRDAGLYDY